MKDLIDKLKNDSISEEEMLKLRNDISSCSDEELNRQIEESSARYSFSIEDIADLEETLTRDTFQTKRMRRWIKVLSVAAAVLIPLLVISLIFIWEGNHKINSYDNFLSKVISINTDKGENTNFMLPDGSMITMRPLSNLSYTLGDFNQSDRKITFTGEGSFEIKHDKDHPFTLSTNGFTIRVLGTTFSLFCREDSDYAEVFLKNGSIILSSINKNEEVQLTPGQKAVINTSTGKIKIMEGEGANHVTAGEISKYYESTPLEKICKDLNIYFNQNIEISDNLKMVTFTGILPTDDFESCCRILELTMGIKFIQQSPSSFRIE